MRKRTIKKLAMKLTVIAVMVIVFFGYVTFAPEPMYPLAIKALALLSLLEAGHLIHRHRWDLLGLALSKYSR